ncbi:MAG: quinohemoprotein amine dehydrogenase maturation protein [Acidobacteria bacterium]|nr:quinohemoprotein amine dehydrogenase maturation protein [Acidobacteriota bacterium]
MTARRDEFAGSPAGADAKHRRVEFLSLGECHPFEAAGRRFLYLVPSAAVFALDETSAAVVDALSAGRLAPPDLFGRLAGRFALPEVEATLAELAGARVIVPIEPGPPAPAPKPAPNIIPLKPIPLSTLVVNVTNRCNLACTYCYEYGEDRIAEPTAGGMPKLMSEETARESVDFMIERSGNSPVVRLTFFGGETLLNFAVLEKTIPYARHRAAEVGKRVEFSLTTNGTLLRPEVIEFLADNDVGVTISIDGPKEMQDRFRTFHDGRGSYDVVAPKVRELLRRHRSRPIGARVTLTSDVLDITRIYRHLTEDIGFWEVGFAPVTTSPGRAHAIGDSGFDSMLAQFRELGREFLQAALEGRHHGFSNVADTIEELHKGASKALPCGAGLGLMGVATNGDVALCHRFAGSGDHKLGTVREGVDESAQEAFLDAHHIDRKTDCRTCWARPLCAGGCYHEAYTRYGTTQAPNLHYCEWIRGWTETCLEIYGEIAERNPSFLRRFEGGDPPDEVNDDASPTH